MKLYLLDEQLTKETTAERVNMAYNLFCSIDHSTEHPLTFDGNMDSQYFKDRYLSWYNGPDFVEKQYLRILDENGNEVEPVIDKEWFGSESDKQVAQDLALTKKIEAMMAEGSMDINYDTIRDEMEAYTVSWIHEETPDDPICAFPSTYDMDKARLMLHVIVDDFTDNFSLGIPDNSWLGNNGSISLDDEDDKGDKRVGEESRFCVTNSAGDICERVVVGEKDMADFIAKFDALDKSLQDETKLDVK